MSRTARLGLLVHLVLVAPFFEIASSATAGPPAPVACNTTKGACWRPSLDAPWQYQLQGVSAYSSTGGINVNIGAISYTGSAVTPQVFDIDLYVDQDVSGNNTTLGTAAVSRIHSTGGGAICYVSAGTWENWRADANQFPASVLDARVQTCQRAGFDGVEWDNVDGFSNRTGFALTYQDQLTYNASLANLAHQYGLSVALKNDVGQLADLSVYFDYAVNEQCQQYNECGGYTTYFINAGKAVFQVEYKSSLSKTCPQANSANRNAISKTIDLYDTPWAPCR